MYVRRVTLPKNQIQVRDNFYEAVLEPEYNIKKRITDLINTTPQHAFDFESSCNSSNMGANFATGGILNSNYSLPYIEILEQNGKAKIIPLPITDKSQADELIKSCSKCPFGRGEKTLFDENVRKSWQLEPNQFRIPKVCNLWNESMQALVKQVQMEMGISPQQQVGFSLYKLLLYEEGGFFDFHRDTEKEYGMIATLVVQLPSVYSGGEVIVRHNDGEKRFDFHNQLSSSYISFYTDCSHRVEKITSGYRVALIYNLVYVSETIPVMKNIPAQLEAQKIIESWEKNPLQSSLCYVLEHKYSIAGLKPCFLKGKDALVYRIFSQLDSVETIVAILEKEEFSYFSSDYDYSVLRSCNYKYRATVYDENNDDIDTFYLLESSIFPDNLRRDMDQTNLHSETTGNEGATIQRWYKSACIMIIPKKFKSMRYDIAMEKLSEAKPLLEEYKLNPTERVRQLLMIKTADESCLTEGIEISGEANSKNYPYCLALNYLPLSMMFVESVLIGSRSKFSNVKDNINIAKVIKHHGVEPFKNLYLTLLHRFLSKKDIHRYTIEAVCAFLMEINDFEWVTPFLQYLSNCKHCWDFLTSLAELKQKFNVPMPIIDQKIEEFVQAELFPKRKTEYSYLNPDLVVKLNRIELVPKLFQGCFLRYTPTDIEGVVQVMKHFGMEKIVPIIDKTLLGFWNNNYDDTSKICESLQITNGPEERLMITKTFELIAKSIKPPRRDNVKTIHLAKVAIMGRKFNLPEIEKLACQQMTSIRTPKEIFNAVQIIVKDLGTRCFQTGTGLRLVLEHCYSTLYSNGISDSEDGIDVDIGLVPSLWEFKHLEISCKCKCCSKVNQFLLSNEKGFSMKERARNELLHTVSLLNDNDLDIECFEDKGKQYLSLEKVMYSYEAKKEGILAIEKVLKQFLQYAADSDNPQPPTNDITHQRPGDYEEPPTKKVKQEVNSTAINQF